ncbi:MAG: Hsp20/alpha crystallin family protein [Desulfobulbaceae bacterium]
MTKTEERKELEVQEKRYPESHFGEVERYVDRLFRHPFSLMRPTFLRGEYPRLEELSPSVDIFEEGNDLVLKAELPGMTKDDVKITLSENMITLSGEKKHEEKVEKKEYQWSECSYGSFTRSFRLPDNVKGDEAKAEFHDGVLKVRIPKTAEVEPERKTIPIE